MKTLILLAALAFSGDAASADDSRSARDIALSLFEAADTDTDAVLSQDEFASAKLAEFGASFSDLDADDDGGVSRTEYLAAFDRHHSMGQGA